ncbi:hypothetical protein K2P96_01790 [Patescibacteria group bacterium]|nr:hypothetical protein [Patescibacteria group bacterium]
MVKSLLDLFSSLDKATKDVLADIDSPRVLAFLTLYLARVRFSTDALSAEHIVAYLESAGVAVKKKSIGRALSGAKGFVSRSINDDGEVFYKLMTKGEREAEKVLNVSSGLAVLRIEAGQPRQARLKLSEILKSLNGVVRICDPFYGVGTLDSLDLISKNCDVKFISQKTNESATSISSAIKYFYKERPRTELRIAQPGLLIHDRYIITKDQIMILGHGVKDIGNKESFVIVLDRKLVPDLISELIVLFDKEWSKAIKIV